MLKISDFSKLAQVPTATLRYYDQLGLLKPAAILLGRALVPQAPAPPLASPSKLPFKF